MCCDISLHLLKLQSAMQPTEGDKGPAIWLRDHTPPPPPPQRARIINSPSGASDRIRLQKIFSESGVGFPLVFYLGSVS